jgi:sulfatase modifying factor 1
MTGRGRQITRREFMRFSGFLITSTAVGACSARPTSESPTGIPAMPASRTPTLAPTVTPGTPTAEIQPAIFPRMAIVEPGIFMMGSDDGLPKEQPVHRVEITRPFNIGLFPVTNDEYSRLCAVTMKCIAPTDDLPVTGVDWNAAVEYCNWLSEQAGLEVCFAGKGKLTRCNFEANGYRLPTEAEWEFAARGGNLSADYEYAGGDDPEQVAWYADNSGGTSHPVGRKLPNELGVYDMSGNCWEWCWDWFDGDYYAKSPQRDPAGPEKPPGGLMLEKSRRSGGYSEGAQSVRIAYRSADLFTYAGGNGFRVAQTAF